MTTIIGLDFSGAQSETKANTWIAQGHLDNDGGLWLDSAHPIRRDDLHDLLADVEVPAVVAMDFPFGVPAALTAHLNIAGSAEMPAVWGAVAGMTWGNFENQRNALVNAGLPDQRLDCCPREPMRAGDAIYHHRPNSYSPLHRVNPDMLPMTYRGICMLHHLHLGNPLRWHIPPMEPRNAAMETVTLLELSPREFLRSIALPFEGYKGGQQFLQLRMQILNGLGAASGVPLHYPDTVHFACRANDDCLDAVVAAAGAAMWAQDYTRFHPPWMWVQNRARFRHPTRDEIPDARLEGWIYAPLP